jgi:hypothetical protein
MLFLRVGAFGPATRHGEVSFRGAIRESQEDARNRVRPANNRDEHSAISAALAVTAAGDGGLDRGEP